jgi:hypothetical protein
MGRLLILAGLALVVLGVLVIAFNRFNIPLGRLPGDVVWRGKNSTFYFPWVTCLVISVVLTLLFSLFNRRP